MSDSTELENQASPVVVPSSGSLAVHRPEAVLRFCEGVRFTGTLAFQSDRGRGVLPMLNGVPEIAPGDVHLEQALEQFLALEHGTYTLVQILPALEGASREGDLGLWGSLERVRPAELLRYCEGAGLSGTLTLRHGERTCVARYDRGELVSLTVDDDPGADPTDVFAWTQGTFAIRARSVFDHARPSNPPHDNERLLKTLEVALVDILEKSQRGATGAAASGTVSSAPSIQRTVTLPFGVEGGPGAGVAVSSSVRSGARRSVPPPPSPESTVKVYFVNRGPPRRPSGTQHAAVRLGTEVVQLDIESQKLTAVSDPSAVLQQTSGTSTETAEAGASSETTSKKDEKNRSLSDKTSDKTDVPASVSTTSGQTAVGDAYHREAISTDGGNASAFTGRSRSSDEFHWSLTAIFAAVVCVTAGAALYILISLVR